MSETVNLQEAIKLRNAMAQYRDQKYLSLIEQINEKAAAMIKPDLGAEFVKNCGRDLAGEIVRNYFDTSEYNITVDQLANRILKFDYDNDYDPLKNNSELQKNVYNYDDSLNKQRTKAINDAMDSANAKLFEINQDAKKYEDQSLMAKGKKEYVNSAREADGSLRDEYTGKVGGTYINAKGNEVRRLEVDHVQAAATAKYNERYTSKEGKQALKKFYNSADNFAMMDKIPNISKGDVKVFEKNGRSLSPQGVRDEKASIEKELRDKTGTKPSKTEINEVFAQRTKDITHRATPKQLADAICDRWENAQKDTTQKELHDKGYLNEDGKVPKSVRAEMERNIEHSQNAESEVILEDDQIYKAAAKDACKSMLKNAGKMIAGQVIYYAAPPIVFEVRCMLKKDGVNIDGVFQRLKEAAKRIGDYICKHLKDIFANIGLNSIKSFIKMFLDMLISLVKETVKKIFSIAKRLILSIVDAIKIIADPNATRAQKADSVFNLFGMTITNILIELLFEFIEKGLHIPEFLLKPLQMLTSVVCTNLVMLILDKLDLFHVRKGKTEFNVRNIEKLFAEEREKFEEDMRISEAYTDSQVAVMLERAKADSVQIYHDLMNMDTQSQSVRGSLQKINTMFNINIDFDAAWYKFLGLDNTMLVLMN